MGALIKFSRLREGLDRVTLSHHTYLYCVLKLFLQCYPELEKNEIFMVLKLQILFLSCLIFSLQMKILCS